MKRNGNTNNEVPDTNSEAPDTNSEAPDTGESMKQGRAKQSNSSGQSESAMTTEYRRDQKASRQQILLDIGTSLAIGVIALAVSWYTAKMMDPSRSNNHRKTKEKKRMIKERHGKQIETNQYEDIIAQDVVNPQQLHTSFSDIGGLESAKSKLFDEVIMPLSLPSVFKGSSLLEPPKGVLLYGPPGTGKTMLAKAVAKECNAVFINLKVSQLMSKWYGDASKLTTAVFTLAWKLSPAIIFIDEADSFLGRRKGSDHETTANMKTEFMQLWDGLNEKSDQLIVLAATNRPDALDDAILRRLPVKVNVPSPDEKQREQILKVHLRGEAVGQDVDYQELAEKTKGFSGFDLHELCRRSAYRVAKEYLASMKRNENTSREGDDVSQESSSVPSIPRKRSLVKKDFLEEISAMEQDSQQARSYRMADVQENEGDFPRVSLDLEALFEYLTRFRQPNGNGS